MSVTSPYQHECYLHQLAMLHITQTPQHASLAILANHKLSINIKYYLSPINGSRVLTANDLPPPLLNFTQIFLCILLRAVFILAVTSLLMSEHFSNVKSQGQRLTSFTLNDVDLMFEQELFYFNDLFFLPLK